MAQESLIRSSCIPYTILRSTPYFEYLTGIVESAADGNVLRLSPAPIQPIAADDVVVALREVAMGRPQNREVEIVGPDRYGLDELAEQILRRLAKGVHEHVQPATVGHSEDDLPDALGAGLFDGEVEQRNQAFRAFQ